MVMHFQTWDNGKYGRIWAVDDDDYSWKFTEIVNGCASEEDFQKSPVIASHFIGYCINNEPKGDGDIYTPFYTYYYKERLEIFRKKHKDDIGLIRDAKRLETLFLNEHAKEEQQAYEDSRILFEFDASKENAYSLLYYGYMDYLREKTPRYFVFKEIPIPQVFPWREFDKIAVMGYRVTELCLDQVLEWSLGRVFTSDIVLRGISPKAEDMEQIKVLYGNLVKPYEVNYIRFNTTDKKNMAQSIYDNLRLDMKQRQFNNDMELQLVIEHAERWFNRIVETAEQKQNIDVVKHQLELCLRKIDEDNKNEHKPFCKFDGEPLDDANVVAGLDCYGYSSQPYYRLEDDEFNAMMEAFDKWASGHYGNEISNDGEQITFEPLSSELNKYLHGMQNSMFNENIIGEIQYNDFVNCIYQANFKTMYDAAKSKRSLKRLFLIIGRIKTWFPNEWETQAASSMGITVRNMRNITLSEIEQGHSDWYNMLDRIFPKRNSMK
jgi:hypothetical protein